MDPITALSARLGEHLRRFNAQVTTAESCTGGGIAEAITRKLGDRVSAIATINEPWCVAWLSHFMGIHAPGLRDIRAAARAMHHILLAHGLAV